MLRLRADLSDAPARYLLTVHSGRVDPCLASAAFTVEGRGDPVDRGPGECGPGECGPGECGQSQAFTAAPAGGQTVPVDYLAKDFASFLGALSNFSAARYPLWAERSEADFGVMLMEALSALADELSCLQESASTRSRRGR